ncbi:class I SAM-dependent methyltransferase [Halorhodospira halophila]|uniref:class I SAM-dependent methyltransferase n=1 Tax=Halorhodospira halophila TaxID=1053 RepID=UPI0005A2F199|nr:class I SAM-dependent methyltransferase [Halorhodospira halophila]MBK1727935.1 class I SAM-dependent methyltransferase [Halorhodospira halophila]
MRSAVYDALILRLTARWYAEVLERLPEGAHVLDVGVGTAGALLANAERVRERDQRVTGIDIDGDYIERARQRVAASVLAERVALHHESVYDHDGGPYDAVYFSASFMLLPEPERALRHCARLLRPGGCLLFTQTIQRRRAPWLERLKPMLRRMTSIDFGRVTYEETFRAQIRAGGLELEAWETLAEHAGRASCLVVARPAGG